MTLKEWRKKNRFTQKKLAEALESFAQDNFPKDARKLGQRTLGYWEKGVMPQHRAWVKIISEFTNGCVTASCFIPDGQ